MEILKTNDIDNGWEVVFEKGGLEKSVEVHWDDVEAEYDSNPYGSYNLDEYLNNCTYSELMDLVKEAACEKVRFFNDYMTNHFATVMKQINAIAR